MKKLFLDLNHIGPQGAVAISEAIAGMSGLQKLCLENNDIGVHSFPYRSEERL